MSRTIVATVAFASALSLAPGAMREATSPYRRDATTPSCPTAQVWDSTAKVWKNP